MPPDASRPSSSGSSSSARGIDRIPHGAEDCVLQLLVTSDVSLHLLGDAVSGGVDLLQVRDKGADVSGRQDRVQAIVDWAQTRGVPVLVNDDVQLAKACGATGVHVGADDTPPDEARRILGPRAWIGWSTHGADEVRAAPAAATHVGLGACFASTTKSDTQPLARDELRAALEAADRPVFAIGGLDQHNLSDVVACGVTRIAVSSCIVSSLRPGHVAEQLRRILHRA